MLVVLVLQCRLDWVVSLTADTQKVKAGRFWENSIELKEAGRGKGDLYSVLGGLLIQRILWTLGIDEYEIFCQSLD